MKQFIVKDREGREIQRGDVITDFRGERTVFQEVSRGPQAGKSAMVLTGRGYEVYAEVFGLTVTEEEG